MKMPRHTLRVPSPWLALTLLVASCGKAPQDAGVAANPHSARPTSWPSGSVISINGRPILGEQVDQLCPAVLELYPAYALPHQRRLVLTNLFLDREAVASRDHAAWEQAREKAEREWLRLQAGEPPSLPSHELYGGHDQLGFGVWAHASQVAKDVWVGPFDVVGQWVILRTTSHDLGTHAIGAEVLEFPYIDESGRYGDTLQRSLQAAHDSAQLEFIDPTWAEYVPMQWQYEMRNNP